MEYVKKDGIVAWAICFCAFVTAGIVTGIDNSLGVVAGSVAEHLQVSVSTIAWIGAVHSTAQFLVGAAASFLLKKVSMRIVIIMGAILCCMAYTASSQQHSIIGLVVTYGVLAGSGSGLLYTPTVISCAYYFDKYKAIATGLAMSGNGLGVVWISLLSDYTSTTFGVEGYFISLGATSCLPLAFAFLASPVQIDSNDSTSEMTALISEEDRNSSEIHTESSTEDNRSWENAVAALTLLKDARLSLYFMTNAMFELAYYVPLMYLPELMASKNQAISADAGHCCGWIISIVGFMMVVGKVLAGLLVQYTRACPILCSAVCLVLAGCSCFGISVCSNYEEFIGVTVAYCLSITTFNVYQPLILIKMFGQDNLNNTFGVVMLAKVLAPLCGSPLAGAISDWTGTYSSAFHFAGAVQLAAASCNFLVVILWAKNQ